MPRTQTLCVLALWLLDAWLTPFPVAAQAIAGEPNPNAASPRNVWYWSSPVNMHWDNHGNPLGQGMAVDEIVKLFAGIKVDMIQVSARSAYSSE